MMEVDCTVSLVVDHYLKAFFFFFFSKRKYPSIRNAVVILSYFRAKNIYNHRLSNDRRIVNLLIMSCPVHLT